MVTIDAILDVLPMMSVAVAIIYYAMTLRNSNRMQRLALETRQAQLFMQLYNTFASEEFLERAAEVAEVEWEDTRDYWENHHRMKYWAHWMWLNGLGLVLKEGLISPEMVYHLTGGMGPVWLWNKYEEVIGEARERYNNPDFFIWFEYLVGELKRIREERGMTSEWVESERRFAQSPDA